MAAMHFDSNDSGPTIDERGFANNSGLLVTTSGAFCLHLVVGTLLAGELPFLAIPIATGDVAHLVARITPVVSVADLHVAAFKAARMHHADRAYLLGLDGIVYRIIGK